MTGWRLGYLAGPKHFVVTLTKRGKRNLIRSRAAPSLACSSVSFRAIPLVSSRCSSASFSFCCCSLLAFAVCSSAAGWFQPLSQGCVLVSPFFFCCVLLSVFFAAFSSLFWVCFGLLESLVSWSHVLIG